MKTLMACCESDNSDYLEFKGENLKKKRAGAKDSN